MPTNFNGPSRAVGPVCVYMSLRTNVWPRHLARWFTLTLSSSHSKGNARQRQFLFQRWMLYVVAVTRLLGKVSTRRAHNKQLVDYRAVCRVLCAKAVGATSSEGCDTCRANATSPVVCIFTAGVFFSEHANAEDFNAKRH